MSNNSTLKTEIEKEAKRVGFMNYTIIESKDSDYECVQFCWKKDTKEDSQQGVMLQLDCEEILVGLIYKEKLAEGEVCIKTDRYKYEFSTKEVCNAIEKAKELFNSL